MARAIHGLESPLLLFDIKQEHVVFVILPVPGGFPKFAVVHIGRDDYNVP
jgi:hypothetical protein